ncbi:MAG: extracellular solute-binding protein [Chloroflexota bacterium]|nr:extracellular solute-binding protein [Chloroflexota bacterium]
MSRISRQRFLRGAAAAACGLLAAACDLRPSSTPQLEVPGAATAVPPRPPGGMPAQASPPRTVQVLTWSDWLEVHRDVLDLLAEEFTSRHPPLTVDWQPVPLTSGPDAPALGLQIEQLHSAGLLFDVMQLPLDFTSHLFIGDAAVDLYPYIRSDKYDLADYWPGAIEAMQWQRQLYGLHTQVRPSVLLLNRALFEQVGLPMPMTAWTWPQFLAAARRLTDRRQSRPIFGFALAVPRHYFTLPWVWGNGGTMLSADRGESLVAGPAAQEALQWLRDLALVHELNPRGTDLREADAHHAGDLFVDGQLAILYGFGGSGRTLTHTSGRASRGYAIAAPPRGPRQAASFLGRFFGACHLSKTARVPEEAWRFLSWWTSLETQRQYQAKPNRFVLPPARRSLADEFVDRYGAATLAVLAYARPLPLHPKWYDLVQAYDQGLVPVWKGEQSVAEATAAIASEQNAILAEWRRKQQGTP